MGFLSEMKLYEEIFDQLLAKSMSSEIVAQSTSSSMRVKQALSCVGIMVCLGRSSIKNMAATVQDSMPIFCEFDT